MKNVMSFLKKSWPEVIRPVVVLVVICICVSAALAVTNFITAPVIAEGELLRNNGSRVELFPAEAYNKLEGEWDGVAEAYDVVTGGEVVGYIITGIAKGYGEGRLKQLLYEKRVPKELWQQALQELPDPMEQIQVFLHKRFRTAPTDPRERKRAADALLRRGFGWNDIRRAMERYGSSEEFGEYEE